MPLEFEKKNFLTVGRDTLHNGQARVTTHATTPVSIGAFCAIGFRFAIMPINHDVRFASVQNSFYRKYLDTAHPGSVGAPSRQRSKGGVTIGNDVWIADNVTVLSGVTIGDGCCIGAGSIVTKSLPPYTIAAGSPCRPLRRRYSDEVVELLLELAWWNWGDERIRRNKAFFIADLSEMSTEEVRALIVE